MDKLITTANGGIPVTLNDLRWSSGQESNQGIIQALNGMLVGEAGDNFIVSGCVVTGSNPTKSLTAGWIVLSGELLRVDAISATLDTSTNNYYEKVTTYDAAGDKTMLNGSATQMYQKNRATITASSGNLTSTGNRIVDLVGSAWTNQAYDAGDFTASGGTWTVASGNVITNKYKVVGKIMHWIVRLDSTTTSGTPSTLEVLVPGGHTIVGDMLGSASVVTTAAEFEHILCAASGGTQISLLRYGVGVDFSDGTNTHAIYFSGTFEIA